MTIMRPSILKHIKSVAAAATISLLAACSDNSGRHALAADGTTTTRSTREQSPRTPSIPTTSTSRCVQPTEVCLAMWAMCT